MLPQITACYVQSETNANYVTNSAFDPVSKQPELKFCAVRIEPNDASV